MIRPPNNPLVASDSLAVVRGNLAPDGAVIKPAAAEVRLHRHSGRAVVFESYDEMAARIDDPDLPVDEELSRRRAVWTQPPPPYARGYGRLFAQHISQANKGCDFDSLKGTAPIPDPEIH